jgi:hypothetical protein
MDYAAALVGSVPPAREATAAAWQSDACLRAFFATPDDIARELSRSPVVRSWFEENGSASEVHAVLSMLMVERRVLGVALEGHMLKRDVPQTTVSFGDYRAKILGSTEAELRRDIEHRIVDQLALASMSKVTQERSSRQVLEQERALLSMRLHLCEARGSGMAALAGTPELDREQLSRVQADLAINEANLKSVAGGPGALDFQLECLREMLASPREHFFVSDRRLRLDRMNVVMSEDDTAPGETLDLKLARVPMSEGPPELRTFVLVRFPRAALLPRSTFLTEAARLLH